MRTTIAIADDLLEGAKRQARRRGLTLGELVEAGLRRELALADDRDERPPVPVFDGRTGPREGVDLNSNRALLEVLDEGADLDRRR